MEQATDALQLHQLCISPGVRRPAHRTIRACVAAPLMALVAVAVSVSQRAIRTLSAASAPQPRGWGGLSIPNVVYSVCTLGFSPTLPLKVSA
ncbi:hypothetical protein IG631_22656 [Alternaria alternata]|nr:hypothetical protein IG631_22656 [Alternaria alternata]